MGKQKIILPPGLYHAINDSKLPKQTNWDIICAHVTTVKIRQSICQPCGHGVLYDKNDQKYHINRMDTLEEVKKIISKIEEINGQ